MAVGCKLYILLALLVVAMGSGVRAEERTLVFGISLGLNATESGDFDDVQQSTKEGLELWRDWWNGLDASKRTTSWGMTFKIALHIVDNSKLSDPWGQNTNELNMYSVYANMIANSSIDYFFPPVASPWDIQLRNYTWFNHSLPVMVAPLDSSEAWYSIPGSYGAPTANILALTSWLPYLRVAKATNVAVLHGGETFLNELCQGVIDQADINDLKVPLRFNMPFDYVTLGKIIGEGDREAVWTAALDQVIAADPDAVAICDFGYGAEYALTHFRKKNWTPKAMMASMVQQKFADPSLLDYVTTTSYYSPSARFPSQNDFTNSAGYNTLIMQRTGKTANSYQARATLAGMIFSSAILNTKSNTSEELDRVLASNQFRSFMGTSAFDASHRQTLTTLVTQLMANNTVTRVIGPAQAAVDEYIYPMPTWKERIFLNKWGNGVEIAGVVLMVIGGAITLGWTIFLFVHWNHKVIIAASPVFCLTILLGSMLVFISIFNWMPNLINDSICNLRAWLLPLGFFMMFGSLIAKTDRINRLYNSKGLNIIIIPNSQVALIILAICVIQSIISILMITVTKLKAQVHIVDDYRVSKNFWVCTFPTSLKILFGIDVGYAGLLLIWGSYLAYRIRTVPISIYDESKVIAFSIYNTAFFGAIVIVIQLAVGNSNRNVTFIITAVCCFLGAVITTSTLFLAKWVAIYRPNKFGKGSSNTRVTTSSSGNSSSGNGNGNGTGGNKSNDSSSPAASPPTSSEKKKYKKKIKALKNRNAELQERIRQLEALAKAHGLLQESEGAEELQSKA